MMESMVLSPTDPLSLPQSPPPIMPAVAHTHGHPHGHTHGHPHHRKQGTMSAPPSWLHSSSVAAPPAAAAAAAAPPASTTDAFPATIAERGNGFGKNFPETPTIGYQQQQQQQQQQRQPTASRTSPAPTATLRPGSSMAPATTASSSAAASPSSLSSSTHPCTGVHLIQTPCAQAANVSADTAITAAGYSSGGGGCADLSGSASAEMPGVEHDIPPPMDAKPASLPQVPDSSIFSVPALTSSSSYSAATTTTTTLGMPSSSSNISGTAGGKSSWSWSAGQMPAGHGCTSVSSTEPFPALAPEDGIAHGNAAAARLMAATTVSHLPPTSPAVLTSSSMHPAHLLSPAPPTSSLKFVGGTGISAFRSSLPLPYKQLQQQQAHQYPHHTGGAGGASSGAGAQASELVGLVPNNDPELDLAFGTHDFSGDGEGSGNQNRSASAPAGLFQDATIDTAANLYLLLSQVTQNGGRPFGLPQIVNEEEEAAQAAGAGKFQLEEFYTDKPELAQLAIMNAGDSEAAANTTPAAAAAATIAATTLAAAAAAAETDAALSPAVVSPGIASGQHQGPATDDASIATSNSGNNIFEKYFGLDREIMTMTSSGNQFDYDSSSEINHYTKIGIGDDELDGKGHLPFGDESAAAGHSHSSSSATCTEDGDVNSNVGGSAVISETKYFPLARKGSKAAIDAQNKEKKKKPTSTGWRKRKKEKEGTDESPKKYNCTLCQHSFAKRTAFTKHKALHETEIYKDKAGRTRFRCATCKKRLTSMVKFVTHRQAHGPDDEFALAATEKTLQKLESASKPVHPVKKRTYTKRRKIGIAGARKTSALASSLLAGSVQETPETKSTELRVGSTNPSPFTLQHDNDDFSSGGSSGAGGSSIGSTISGENHAVAILHGFTALAAIVNAGGAGTTTKANNADGERFAPIAASEAAAAPLDVGSNTTGAIAGPSAVTVGMSGRKRAPIQRYNASIEDETTEPRTPRKTKSQKKKKPSTPRGGGGSSRVNAPRTPGSARKQSRFIGVTPVRWGRWRARAWVNGVQRHLGYFDNEVDAARAFDKEARMLGKKTNFDYDHDYYEDDEDHTDTSVGNDQLVDGSHAKKENENETADIDENSDEIVNDYSGGRGRGGGTRSRPKKSIAFDLDMAMDAGHTGSDNGTDENEGVAATVATAAASAAEEAVMAALVDVCGSGTYDGSGGSIDSATMSAEVKRVIASFAGDASTKIEDFFGLPMRGCAQEMEALPLHSSHSQDDQHGTIADLFNKPVAHFTNGSASMDGGAALSTVAAALAATGANTGAKSTSAKPKKKTRGRGKVKLEALAAAAAHSGGNQEQQQQQQQQDVAQPTKKLKQSNITPPAAFGGMIKEKAAAASGAFVPGISSSVKSTNAFAQPTSIANQAKSGAGINSKSTKDQKKKGGKKRGRKSKAQLKAEAAEAAEAATVAAVMAAAEEAGMMSPMFADATKPQIPPRVPPGEFANDRLNDMGGSLLIETTSAPPLQDPSSTFSKFNHNGNMSTISGNGTTILKDGGEGLSSYPSPVTGTYNAKGSDTGIGYWRQATCTASSQTYWWHIVTRQTSWVLPDTTPDATMVRAAGSDHVIAMHQPSVGLASPMAVSQGSDSLL